MRTLVAWVVLAWIGRKVSFCSILFSNGSRVAGDPPSNRSLYKPLFYRFWLVQSSSA